MQDVNKPVVIHFLSSMRDGGAETIVKDYALIMKRVRVIIVTIYPLDTIFANVRLLSEAGVECYSIFETYPRYKIPIYQKVWNKFCYDKYVSTNLLRIIKETNAVSLHVHMNVLQYVKMISNSIRSVKVFYTCHNIVSRYFNHTDRKKETNAAKHLLRYNNLQLIALHDDMRIAINSLFNIKNTIVIRNGIDFNRFKPSQYERCITREMLGMSQDTFVVGHVGRFSKIKNHAFLIDIFAEILQREPDSHLLLIGDGPEKDAIQEKVTKLAIQESVIFLSHRTDISQLLNAMDVFVFPSIYEGLPVSLVEAQVVGLRCVVSDSVTTSCLFSENAVPLSITDDSKHWAEVILDKNYVGPYTGQIKLFDMNTEISRLEEMYLGV